jgi:hypothetical protein
MGEILDINKLQLFLIFAIPGFISIKIWSLLVPSQKIPIGERCIELICYSFINFSLLFWLIDIAESSEGILKNILYIAILFIAPIIWPIIWKQLLSSKKLRGRIIHPTPKAWDYFFSLGKSCFMLIHLKSGKLIGGLYHENSFSSSYPEKEDLYIKEVWKVNKNGKFIEKINGTEGMLINYDIINYIELFEKKLEGENNNVKN